LWITQAALKDVYPRLCGISKDKDKIVEEFVGWEDHIWKWMIPWRCDKFAWEAIQEAEMM